MKNKDLALIVQEVKLNKEAHFEKLYDATWDTVYFITLNMMGNKNDAEDVTQEVFIKIYNKIEQLKSLEAFNRWMNTLVMNTCKNALEKRKLGQIYNSKDENIDDVAVETNVDFLPSDFINSKETKSIVEELVQELPEKQKQAIILYYYQEYSISQIAEILECTTTVINNRLYYAKIALRNKAECIQKDHGIKLYNVSAIPVLSIILKTYANEVCNDTTRVSIWNEVSTKISIGASIPGISFIKRLLSKVKNNPLSSVASTSSSFVSNAVIVVGATSMVVSTGYVANNFINQEQPTTNTVITKEVNNNTKAENNKQPVKKETSKNKQEDSKDATPDVEEDDTTTISDTIIESEAQVSNEVPIVSTPDVVVQGTKISTISTTSSEMNLPAGSIITNGVGDRIFMAAEGTLETDGSITTAGNIATVPFALVNQIQLDSLGNRLLPTGTILNNLDGTTSTYSGNIQVDKQNNSIKKLPFEVDVASGDLNIELIDDKLVITGSDVEIIIEKDTVIDIINTSSEDRTIIVDGCDVAFGKTEATIKVINDGRAIRQTITTTSTIKNFIPGTISTTTKRNKLKGSQSLLEPVKKEVNDKLNLDTNPLAKTNGEKETMLNMMIIINLIILVIIILLFVYKHKEKEKMKLKNILKTTAITFLAIFVASNGMMNNLLAEEEQEPTVGIGETTKVEPVTPEQEVEIITNEEDKVEAATRVVTASASLGFNKLNEVVATEEVVGVETLVENDTTLVDAFPDVNFRTYVWEKVLGKATYNDATDSGTTLTADDITKITVNTTSVNVASKEIVSMEGIQHFVNLTSLDCRSNKITELNLAYLVLLTSLSCSTNQLSNLDVTSLISLTSLNCPNNKISELDVSKLNKLTSLNCYNNQISELNVSELKNLKTLNCYNNQIKELAVFNLIYLDTLNCNANQIKELDVSKLTKLITLNCSSNQITDLNVSDLLILSTLDCNNNNISILDLSKLNNLTQLIVYRNPISSLDISSIAKTKIQKLYYRSTNIENMDLDGFTALTALNVTKSINGDLSKLKALYVSGSRSITDNYLVRLSGDVGSFSWESSTGYYIINSGMNAKYGFNFAVEVTPTNPSGVATTLPENETLLPNGGLVDQEGNLIIGASLENIDDDDGSIIMQAGSSIATPEGTITFDGYATIKDGTITTESNFSIDKTTTVTDQTTGVVTVVPGGNITTVETGNGTTTIHTSGSEIEVPKGAVITNNEGDKTFVTDTAVVDTTGTVTSPGTIITVPVEKVPEIVVDNTGTTVLPEGSVVTKPDGETEVVVGEVDLSTDGVIVIKTATEVVNTLLNAEQTDLADGITQTQITHAQASVDAVTDVTEKATLQAIVTKAQNILNAKTLVEALLNEDNSLKTGVTQAQITEALVAAELLEAGTLKDSLKEVIAIVQETFENDVDGDGVFDLNTAPAYALLELVDAVNKSLYTSASVTAVEEARTEVLNILEPPALRTFILANPSQASLDEAVAKLQAAYDGLVTSRDVVEILFNTDKTDLAEGVTQEQLDNAQSSIDELTSGTERDELQALLTKAKNIFNAKTLVDELLNADGSLKPGITQDKITDALTAVELIDAGSLQDQLNETVNVAQETFNNDFDGDGVYDLQKQKAYDLIDQVNAVDATKYTKESITKLNDAKAEVMNILEPATLTRAILAHPSQASLDTAVANLEAAYNGLVLVNVVVNPTKPVVSTGLELPLMSIVALSIGVSAIILRRRYIK